MARTNNLTNFLTDVADAIKEKKGSETAIPAANFDTEILALPSQGTYEQKVVNVSANGSQTILPSQGYDAMDELTLNIAVPINRLQIKSYEFTQNSTLQLIPDSGYDGFSSIEIEINVPTIDTSDATAEAMYIANGKTAYANGEKITGIATTYDFKSTRTATPINFEHDYRSNIDYPDTTMLTNITPMTQSGVAKWKFVTPAISTNIPKPMGPGESVFIEGGKFILAVRESLLAQRFGVTADKIKIGETILGMNGAFSTCNDAGISNVVYKSYWFDGPFEKLASGYYKFDSNDMSMSRLEITFTKDTAGDVKLSYKGSGLNIPDPENPESTLSYVYVDLDDSGTPLEPTDASNYTELTFSNVTVGEHTILIEVETGTDTVFEIKLLDEKPITASDIAKGLIGFANGNKVEGTYLPDIEYSIPLAPSSWSMQDVGIFFERISNMGARISKINHTIDCTGMTGLSWPSGFNSGLRYVEEFPTLVNTSGITVITSGLWTNFSNLKVISLFDISGITYADSIQILYDVPSTVEEIPAFDLSSFSNPSQFVQQNPPFARLDGKTNLSYESINNLLYTVSTINTQSIIPPYRTMSRLGFSSLTTDYDENIIQTLSNYQAFIDAGWSLS